MSGKGFQTGSKDQFDELLSRVEDLESQVVRLQNIKQPTMPIYPSFAAPNPGDLPDDPVEGQYAVGKDDNIHRWYSNGAWHEADAGRMPWLLLQNGIQNGDTIPGGGVGNDYYLNMGGLITSPLNGGGRIDPTVYGGINVSNAEVNIETGGASNEPFKAIKFRSPGLYKCRAVLGWFTDWGPVRLNYFSSHDDTDNSFLVWDVFLMRTDNTMITAPPTTKLVHNPTTTHNQYSVICDIMFHIDPRAVNPRLRFFAVSDNAHTWNLTDVGGFSVWIIRLSSSGISYP
jgi:hypothetical protein